jgi:hypothetical protein
MPDLTVLKYELAEVENDPGVIELEERAALTMSNLMPDVLGLTITILEGRHD